jgi:hypothetical protein
MWRAIIFVSLTAFMSLVASSQGTQTDRAAAPIVIARPVKRLPVQAPASADIAFDEFEFKLLAGSRHPGTWPIEGEPSKGYTYFVEARVYGLEAIATARFEVLDEHGALIEPARIRRETGAGGSSGFYGLMTVPNRPFRVALTGEAIDGQRYQRIYQRLFKPIDKPVVHPILKQAASRADKRKLSKMLEELIKQESAAIYDRDTAYACVERQLSAAVFSSRAPARRAYHVRFGVLRDGILQPTTARVSVLRGRRMAR